MNPVGTCHKSVLIEVVFSIALVLFALGFYYTQGFGLLQVQPKKSLEDYQWGELKAVAAMISDAKTDEDAIAIAHKYGLCDKNGKPYQDNTKEVYHRGGSGTNQVRIIGFRHDAIDDYKNAGITFCFCRPFDTMPMYYSLDAESPTNGWTQSGARYKLAKCLSTPAEKSNRIDDKLRGVITTVRKKTYTYDVASKSLIEDLSGDRLFLLSYSEVFGCNGGGFGRYKDEYDLRYEGEQYALFRKATKKELKQMVASPGKTIWLRTHSSKNPRRYLAITSKASMTSKSAVSENDTLVAFCL